MMKDSESQKDKKYDEDFLKLSFSIKFEIFISSIRDTCELMPTFDVAAVNVVAVDDCAVAVVAVGVAVVAVAVVAQKLSGLKFIGYPSVRDKL